MCMQNAGVLLPPTYCTIPGKKAALQAVRNAFLNVSATPDAAESHQRLGAGLRTALQRQVWVCTSYPPPPRHTDVTDSFKTTFFGPAVPYPPATVPLQRGSHTLHFYFRTHSTFPGPQRPTDTSTDTSTLMAKDKRLRSASTRSECAKITFIGSFMSAKMQQHLKYPSIRSRRSRSVTEMFEYISNASTSTSSFRSFFRSPSKKARLGTDAAGCTQATDSHLLPSLASKTGLSSKIQPLACINDVEGAAAAVPQRMHAVIVLSANSATLQASASACSGVLAQLNRILRPKQLLANPAHAAVLCTGSHSMTAGDLRRSSSTPADCIQHFSPTTVKETSNSTLSELQLHPNDPSRPPQFPIEVHTVCLQPASDSSPSVCRGGDPCSHPPRSEKGCNYTTSDSSCSILSQIAQQGRGTFWNARNIPEASEAVTSILSGLRGVETVTAELKITPKYGAYIRAMHTPFVQRKSKNSVSITVPPLHASEPLDVTCELALPAIPADWCQELPDMQPGGGDTKAAVDIAAQVCSLFHSCTASIHLQCGGSTVMGSLVKISLCHSQKIHPANRNCSI